ncbi:MAG: EthD family reductase [Candidatus Rokuibacteriota bacterium]
MIKVVTFIKRAAGMPVEAFQSYWRERHPAVVTRLPGVRRYVQSHTLASAYAAGEPVLEPLYDGIAEVWADSTDALRAMTRSPAYAAVQADEAEFIDRATMGIVVTEEHLIKDGAVPVDSVKRVTFLTRKPGLSVEEFQRHWREVHGPLAAKMGVLRRYVQSHTRSSAYAAGRAPAWDGIASAWFDSLHAIRAVDATPEHAAALADRGNFVSPGPTRAIVTREHVIVG